MQTPAKPDIRPANPNFSSGPCAKRPGWTPAVLADALVGRSHRSKPAAARIAELLERHRRVLGLPDGHRIGLVGGSDTAAVELALWNLLGPRGVDVLAWESFGGQWKSDVQRQLKLANARFFIAPYGEIPNLKAIDFDRDVVFTWNGTTSGVRVPAGDWIPSGRQGLTICDATSAVFAMDIPWDKIDVATYSFQKVLGGEAQHGVLILGPRAIERLESHTPAWPVPRMFDIKANGKLAPSFATGGSLNTPSMLVIEDALDGIKWAESIGGTPALIAKSEANLAAIAAWVANSSWARFMAADPAIRSCTSICLKFASPWFESLDDKRQNDVAKRVAALLEKEGVAYDINSYRDAPPGLRIWGGATVATADIQALLPWLDWAYATVAAESATAA